MNSYKELIDSLRICVKYNKAVDALCNAEFAANAIEQLVKERDAAVADLKYIDKKLCTDKGCFTTACDECGCVVCLFGSDWEWRGVQK